MRDPRLRQWGTLGWCGLGWEPRPAGGVRPRPPRRRTLYPAGVPPTDSGAAAAAARSAPASAAQASNFRSPRTRAGRRARGPRGRGPRCRAATPASALTVRGARGAGASGSGQRRIPVPPSADPRLGPLRPRGPPQTPHGGAAAKLRPRDRPPSARRPARAWGVGTAAGGAGTTFRVRPRPAPCPRAAERSALRRWRQDTTTLRDL